MKAALLESHCIVSEGDRAVNLKANLARGLPVLERVVPEHERPLLIVGSGPSVSGLLEYVKHWKGDVWAINGAYDFLLSHGLICEGFFGIDPLPQLADYLRNANEYTTFYISSMCDPAVLDALEGHKVLLWHAMAENREQFPEGHQMIYGGTTAVTRAPFLALVLGYRDINMIGVDSSYDKERGQYCYPWGTYATDIAEMTIPVSINGEGPFFTEIGLCKQIAQLGTMLTAFNRGAERLKIHPAGLMGAFMRAPVLDDSEIKVVPFDELFKTVKDAA
jgi:6-hydroxymethylpterin diphosphokinase MptE-like protein